MNKSIMGCCICNNYKKGEFIIINDKKYHLGCIEHLQEKLDKINKILNDNNISVTKLDKGVGIVDIKEDIQKIIKEK